MKSLNESILRSFKEAFLLEDYKSAKVKLIEKGASEDEADSLISRHKVLKVLNRLDSSVKDIDLLVKNFSPEEIKQKLFSISIQTKSEIKKRIEGKIVAENDEYLVYKIDTPEEAYRFHGLTKWCICSGTESEARMHFNHYSNGFKNVYYFFVRKNITDPDDDWNYIALQRRNEGDDVYWSMEDKPYNISEIPVDLPKFNKPSLEPLSAEERFVKEGFKKNANGEFDIDGDFDLREHDYLIVDGKLVVKFGKVKGNFDCYECENLTSLEGCPREVIGDFDCNSCYKLTSLEGCPEKVGGDFNCSSCYELTNLKGSPEKIGGSFSCSYCENLMSLEGGPREVGGSFYCSCCGKLKSFEGRLEKVGKDLCCHDCEKLTSLKGCPREVGGDFVFVNCSNLTSLKGCPKKVGGNFDCGGCYLITSLKGCPKEVGKDFNCSHCKNLKSLEGCPEKVGGDFNCYYCGIEINEDYVRSLCNVGGEIFY